MATHGLPSEVTLGSVEAGIPLHPCSASGEKCVYFPSRQGGASSGPAPGNWQETSCSHGCHLPETTCGVFPWYQLKELGQISPHHTRTLSA